MLKQFDVVHYGRHDFVKELLPEHFQHHVDVLGDEWVNVWKLQGQNRLMQVAFWLRHGWNGPGTSG